MKGVSAKSIGVNGVASDTKSFSKPESLPAWVYSPTLSERLIPLLSGFAILAKPVPAQETKPTSWFVVSKSNNISLISPVTAALVVKLAETPVTASSVENSIALSITPYQ